MSIYIKGLEMPEVCIDGDNYRSCPMDRLWCAQRFAPARYTIVQAARDQQDKLPSWCPIAPLPEKHGRLIDADALQEEHKKIHDGKRLMLIDVAHTIIPADKEET